MLYRGCFHSTRNRCFSIACSLRNPSSDSCKPVRVQIFISTDSLSVPRLIAPNMNPWLRRNERSSVLSLSHRYFKSASRPVLYVLMSCSRPQIALWSGSCPYRRNLQLWFQEYRTYLKPIQCVRRLANTDVSFAPMACHIGPSSDRRTLPFSLKWMLYNLWHVRPARVDDTRSYLNVSHLVLAFCERYTYLDPRELQTEFQEALRGEWDVVWRKTLGPSVS